MEVGTIIGVGMTVGTDVGIGVGVGVGVDVGVGMGTSVGIALFSLLLLKTVGFLLPEKNKNTIPNNKEKDIPKRK